MPFPMYTNHAVDILQASQTKGEDRVSISFNMLEPLGDIFQADVS